MSNLPSLADTKSTAGDNARRKAIPDLVMTFLLPQGLPLLLGLIMGVLLAIFIVQEQWHFVFGFLLLIPSLILFNAYPYAALIIWLLINPFLQTTPTTTYRIVYWMIHRTMPIMALMVVVLGDLLRVTKKRVYVKLGLAELATVAYMGLAMVNILMFHSISLSYIYLLYDRIFIPICLYWFVRLVAPREREMKLLLIVAFAIVIIESIAGVLSWFAPELLPDHWLRYQGARTTGSLGYPHAYTTTLVFFSFLLFQAAMNRKTGLMRSVLLFVFGLSSLCIFLSFSRGSWLGGLAAAIGLLLMYPKATIRLMVILLIIMAALGSGVLSDQMSFAQERMNSDDTANDRWVIWNAGFQMIKAKPLFGWGYGNYKRYAQQFQARTKNHVVAYAHASHNTYIAIAAETGLPMLLLFLTPLVWWLTLSKKAWPQIPKKGFWSRSLLIVFWMVLLDHIVVNFFSDMQHSTYGMGMWWITLGMIANMVEAYLEPGDMKMTEWFRRAGQTA
ncbi:MAG: hypothetical protein B6I34_08045 [Anaerolineaceae bacterium 4572_32.1]|nr:MAG: hypothetical protein B6I34_08045 [Anaerolineaceae bacterium 4572_32.1]